MFSCEDPSAFADLDRELQEERRNKSRQTNSSKKRKLNVATPDIEDPFTELENFDSVIQQSPSFISIFGKDDANPRSSRSILSDKNESLMDVDDPMIQGRQSLYGGNSLKDRMEYLPALRAEQTTFASPIKPFRGSATKTGIRAPSPRKSPWTSSPAIRTSDALMLTSPAASLIGGHGFSSASKRRKRTSFIESVGQIAIPGAASAQDCSRAVVFVESVPSPRKAPAPISSFLAQLNAVAESPDEVTTPRDRASSIAPLPTAPIRLSTPVKSQPTKVAPLPSPSPAKVQPVRESRVRPPRAFYQPEEPPVGIKITELDSDSQPTSKFARQLKKAALTYVELSKIDDDVFDLPDPSAAVRRRQSVMPAPRKSVVPAPAPAPMTTSKSVRSVSRIPSSTRKPPAPTRVATSATKVSQKSASTSSLPQQSPRKVAPVPKSASTSRMATRSFARAASKPTPASNETSRDRPVALPPSERKRPLTRSIAKSSSAQSPAHTSHTRAPSTPRSAKKVSAAPTKPAGYQTRQARAKVSSTPSLLKRESYHDDDSTAIFEQQLEKALETGNAAAGLGVRIRRSVDASKEPIKQSAAEQLP